MCDLYIFKDECTNNKIETVSILKREANSKKWTKNWTKLEKLIKMGKNWQKLTILDKSDRTRKEMVCRSAMKRCSRLRAIMVSTLLRMTNQFAFRKTERPWQMMASLGLCRFMCHSSSLWKTEQKSVRPPPMEKKPGKNRESLLDFEGTKYTLCSATLIQLSVTCLFCSLELLRSVRKWGK